MSSADPITSSPKPRRKSLWRRLGWGSLLVSMTLVGTMVLVAYLAIGRPIAAPEWLRDRIEARAAQALGAAQLRFDSLDFIVTDGIKPRMRMSNVRLVTGTGAEIASFAEVRAGLSLDALLRGQAQPADIAVTGVVAKLRRLGDGSVVLSGGLDLTAPTQQAASFAQLIERIDTVLSLPALSELKQASVQALTLQIEDVRSARAWTVDGARTRMNRDGDALRLTSDLALLSGGQGVATLEANYNSQIGAAEAEFGVIVQDVAAGDIAALAPPFAWLDVLRAPISGAMRGGVNAAGTLEPLNATLTIGAGVIQPNDATRPVPFNAARSYFSYDPDDAVLTFDELSVDSAWITGQIDGQAFLGVTETGQLQDLIGQFRSSTLTANPDDFYEAPIAINAAEMDFRLTLDPFRLDVGQALFRDQGQSLLAQGTLSAGPNGWSYGFDAQMDGLLPDRLLALWPARFVPQTRDWLSKNLLGGQLRGLDVVLRDTPDTRTSAYVSFSYEDAHVRYVPSLPPITGARGSASLLDNRFVVTVDDGQVIAPQGGIVEVGGSSFIIPDVSVRDGAPSVVRIEATGTVTAALSLLDRPPLSVMDKAGLDPALADGRLAMAGNLAIPLKTGVKTRDLEFNATGIARDVVSTTLLEGRRLAASRLDVTADNEGVQVGGPGTLDGVPFDATWSQPIGETPQGGRVTGALELSERTIDAFNIGLPAGMVTGQGNGDIQIELPVGGAPPRFALNTNLRGLTLVAAPLGWRKGAGVPGALTVEGVLGEAPRVDRLVLDAPGLQATGSVALREDGGLERARFDNVRVGGWMNGPVDLVGRGAGAPPQVVVRAGTLDLREADFGGTSSQGGDGQGGGPLDLALDRLIITDSITLTDLKGDFNMARGLDGAFTARVNGGTPVRGQVLPQNGRSAIRITSDDAGGVAASAGLLKQARGGSLSLTLLPVGSASFDGTLNITETRIQDAPAIAALLNALSIVGLLEQMGGSGIHFREVEASFRLTPSTMTLTQASAVGPSMGLSMDGTYDVTRSVLDMRGVISPIYLLNGIGSIFTRKGEGLIGFNYRLRGAASDPRVSVNPLSAMTPSLFREIFRAPAPELPDVEGDGTPPIAPEAFAPAPTPEIGTEQRLEERQQRIDER
ncbi:DUF3971 domain-containing protein [Tateyamaria sp.]|uniref:YhdP family protein n=1 Tax=Tateyamaria sp. TaxID=1929288 RepID=UPI003B2206BB